VSWLTSIRMKNFKSVAEADVPLSPLTVVVGANSSGKSTLLQSLLLQAQAAESGVLGSLYPLNGPRVRLGDFDEALWAGAVADPDPRIAIGGSIQLGLGPASNFRLSSSYTLHVSWQLEFVNAGPRAASSMQLIGVEIADVVDQREQQFQLRIDQSEQSNVDANRSREEFPTDAGWALDLRGDLFSESSGAPEPIVGARLVAGIPSELVVERESASELVRAWSDAMERAIEAEHARSRSTIPDDLALQVVDLQRRLESARKASDSAIAEALEDRLAVAQSRMLAARTAGLGGTAQADQFYLEVLRLASEDLARFVEEDHPVSSARDVFHQYYAERRRTRTLPNLRAVSAAQVASAAETAARHFKAGMSLVGIGEEDDRDGWLLRRQLRDFFGRQIRYLGPLRATPRARYDAVPNPHAGDIGEKGEAVAAVIEACRDQEVVNPVLVGPGVRMPLHLALDEWFRYLGLGQSVTAEDTGRLGIDLSVNHPLAGRNVDLTALGVGVSQALPVLTLCLLSEPGTLVLLEQPELHLHPATQKLLADFLLACARSGRQLIVETHSDHLVSRLRLHAAEDPTSSVQDLVKIVFAEAFDGSTHYTAVRPSAFGDTSDWPAGFMDQTSVEAQKILRAALAKKKAQQSEAPPK
jgi:predicted ATPase